MIPSARMVWVDGVLLRAEEARISPFDHGLLVGDGVFETLRAYGGVPFAWRRHLDRLEMSARALELRAPDRDVLRDAVDRVLHSNGLSEARVRVTVTGGVQPLGSARQSVPPTVIVAATEVGSVEAVVDVVVAPWPRNERGATAGIKTISYAENVRALALARARGAGEAIFGNTRGDLCEATGSNVFAVYDGRLSTPSLASGCLPGVTRALVLELSHRAGIPYREGAIPVADLAEADEAFLTSTVREVQAVAHVDGRSLGAAPGPVTTRIVDEFAALVQRDPDP